MKKLLTTCLFSVLALAVTVTAEAQYTVGGGLMYGSEIEQFGIRADGFYTINEDFRIGATLGYFFPDEFNGTSFNWFDLDFNGNYFFLNEDELSLYGLGGLNFAFLSINNDNAPNYSETEVGLNLGGGLEYMLDFASLFGELKLAGLGGDADQLVLGAGLRFSL
ncbi:MAG: hypothetical protein WD317_06975 [Balneolaceae bacterium]